MRLQIFIIGFFLFTVATTMVVLLEKKVQRLEYEKDQLVQVASDSGRVARTYINLFGKEVSRNKVLSLSALNAKDLRSTQELAWLNQFEGVNKKLNNLDAALRLQAQYNQTLKIKTRDTVILSAGGPGDSTVRARLFSYKDQYNVITGVTSGDTTLLTAKIIMPIEGAVYWKRKHKFIFEKWRFGRKEYSSELTSKNPFVHITGHEFIKIVKR